MQHASLAYVHNALSSYCAEAMHRHKARVSFCICRTNRSERSRRPARTKEHNDASARKGKSSLATDCDFPLYCDSPLSHSQDCS